MSISHKPCTRGPLDRTSPIACLGLACLLSVPVSELPFAAVADAAQIEEYVTPSPDSSPTDLAFDTQGHLWFTMMNANKIGRLVPAKAKAGRSDGITEYTVKVGCKDG